MSFKRVSPLISALLFAIGFITASSAALAQNRQFSFAYDQPKNSGDGAGAEMSIKN
jgi:TRAP-type transport system periplasmic protein